MRLAIAATVLLVLGCPAKEAPSGSGKEAPSGSGKAAASAPKADPGGKAPAWDGQDPFEHPVVKETPDGFEVTVQRKAGASVPTGIISYTAEPYVVWAQPKTAYVAEAELLNTKWAFDLNGDGDTTDRFPLACAGLTVKVGETELRSVTDKPGGPMTYVADGKPRIRRMGERGAYLLLYSPCQDGTATVGLSAPDQPMKVVTAKGPALQIMVFEPHPDATLPDPMPMTFTIDGVEASAPLHVSLDSEPIFGDKVIWTAMYWAMLPLSSADKQVVGVKLPAHTGKRTVTARVNVSDTEGVRAPMSPGLLQQGQ